MKKDSDYLYREYYKLLEFSETKPKIIRKILGDLMTGGVDSLSTFSFFASNKMHWHRNGLNNTRNICDQFSSYT